LFSDVGFVWFNPAAEAPETKISTLREAAFVELFQPVELFPDGPADSTI